MLINGAVGKGLCGMVPLSGGMYSRVSDCDRIMVYCRRESDESFASQITRTELPVTDSHGGDHQFVVTRARIVSYYTSFDLIYKRRF
ncbi:hypothetical protein NPIL_356281 [Nephila pilipes]|uniref:Uncharacterized protein n=1 Tax=Nephila pilipes TaxID=299642 RepID=A0A8X6UQI7_NEPPI|nr:hypothetical protein NPIL_356281 [Nephila pilipes]